MHIFFKVFIQVGANVIFRNRLNVLYQVLNLVYFNISVTVSKCVNVLLLLRCEQGCRSVLPSEQVRAPWLWFIAETGTERLQDVAERQNIELDVCKVERDFTKPQSITLLTNVADFHTFMFYDLLTTAYACCFDVYSLYVQVWSTCVHAVFHLYSHY